MSALADLHLLRPAWLLIVLPALWLIWRSKHTRKAGSQWVRACDPALLDAMLQQPGKASRWPLWLATVAVVIVALALAGPSWQRLPTPVLQSDAATVIVLDLSKSMDAADLQPSRLSRARFAALDVLDALPEGRVGVVSFAGSAFKVVPLTDDRETARHLINSLTTDVMPVQGGRIGTGLAHALELLGDGAANNGRVVLLTDSSPDRAALRQAEALRTAGHSLQVVGFGTAGGAPVPNTDGGWIKQSDGSIVLARLDSDALRNLASRGGGQYQSLPAAGLLAVAKQWDALADAQRTSRDDLTTDRWLDAGQWLVWLLLVCGCLTATLAAPPATASESNLWRNANQHGKALLDAGEAEQARQAFKAPAWQGVAAYEAGDYAAAAEAFAQSGQAGQADADYNRGNALARAGDLQAALAAYDAQLAAQPEHADAQYNRDLVQALLDQQQQQQQQDQQSGENGENNEDNQPSNEQQQNNGQNQDAEQQQGDQDAQQQQQSQDGDAEQDPGQEPEQQQGEKQPDEQPGDEQQQAQSEPEPADEQAEDGEQTTAGDQPMSDEERAEQQQQQALEQWLRRVPDDPGGLLRRKFAREQARRDEPTESEQAW